MNIERLNELETEALKFKESVVAKQKISLSNEQINEKYLKGEVRIVTEQARYPLKSIKEMFDGENYDLNPNFQRRHRWDVVKQSRLIESFIMNVPIPPVFLYEKDFSSYEVMDGLQRITAIKDFYEDKYFLQGLEKWPELNGMYYSGLPDQIQKGIDRRYISSIILLKETAKDEEEAMSLKRMVFSRINSGGAKLEDQEYRNAECQGKFNDLIIELARNKYFCEIFGIPQKTEDENLSEDHLSEELKNNSRFSSMKDVENVLRFFAIRHIDKWKDDLTLSGFLDLFSEAAKDLNEDILNIYKSLFEETIKLAYDIYGEKSFCLWKESSNLFNGRWSKKPAMVLYDPLMNVLSNMLDYSTILISKKDQIVEETKKLLADSMLFNGRNTNSINVKNRMIKCRDFMEGFL